MNELAHIPPYGGEDGAGERASDGQDGQQTPSEGGPGADNDRIKEGPL